MIKVLKKLAVSFLLLIVMGWFTFWLMHITPGQYFDQLKLDPMISPQTIERYEKMYHLNDPLLLQYGRWLINGFKGDWGYSFFYNVPVVHVIQPRLGNTLLLSFVTIVFTWMIAVPLGLLAALYANRFLDRLLGVFSQLAFATPSFFLAILLLYWASLSGVLPLGGMQSAGWEDMNFFQQGLDMARHLVIPVVVLSLSSIGSLQRMMRSNMLAELNKPYILAARARGISTRRIIFVHALRNAFNPMLTILGLEFGSLLSGAALVEAIVSWPGLGTLMLTAVRSKDIYVVMASFMMGGVMLLLGNALADLCRQWLDPRTRDGKL